MASESCRAAVLAFAEIEAAVDDFNRGESNLFAALERIRLVMALLTLDGEPRREAA